LSAMLLYPFVEIIKSITYFGKFYNFGH